MKIRWTAESVRLRITPSELQAILGTETVREELSLPGGHWAVFIVPAEAATVLTAAGSTLTLALARPDADRLAAPDAEGVYFQQGDFRYFIEKDFPCLHPRATEAVELPTETFTPPEGFEERKGDG